MWIKTSELEGAALDWAVATALGWSEDEESWVTGDRVVPRIWDFRPSTNWNQGGPLIESRSVWISDDYDNKRGPWEAQCKRHVAPGPSILIAAMRAIVTSELGDEVDVPEELL